MHRSCGDAGALAAVRLSTRFSREPVDSGSAAHRRGIGCIELRFLSRPVRAGRRWPRLSKRGAAVSLALNEQSTAARPLDGGNDAAAPLLDAFIIAARHRGVHLSREQVLRDHQLKSPEITVSAGAAHRPQGGNARPFGAPALAGPVQDGNGAAGHCDAAQRLGDGPARRQARARRPARRGRAARSERRRGCAADARRGALQRCLGRRDRSDQARLPPARRGPSVRHGLDHRPAAARSADDPRSCDLRDPAQRSGARADRVLADHDRPGHALRQPQHLYDAVHRLRGAGRVRHRVRPSAPPDGAVPDDPGRRQDLEPYVRSAAQPSDRLLRAHADRRDRARHVRDL